MFRSFSVLAIASMALFVLDSSTQGAGPHGAPHGVPHGGANISRGGGPVRPPARISSGGSVRQPPRVHSGGTPHTVAPPSKIGRSPGSHSPSFTHSGKPPAGAPSAPANVHSGKPHALANSPQGNSAYSHSGPRPGHGSPGQYGASSVPGGRNQAFGPGFHAQEGGHHPPSHVAGKPWNNQHYGVPPRGDYPPHFTPHRPHGAQYVQDVNRHFHHSYSRWYAAFYPGYSGFGYYGGGYHGTNVWISILATPPLGWNTMSSWCSACTTEPCYYNYGDNVTIDGENVRYGDQSVNTVQAYRAEAAEIAAAGLTPTLAEEEWKPLGAFAIMKADKDDPERAVELHLSQSGKLKGFYRDLETNQQYAVVGSVDKGSGRAAFRLADSDTWVIEFGIANTTNDEVPALAYLNSSVPESRLLVRLTKQ